jgi:ribosomal protein S18 acetylase RimI-like enzyme
MLIRKATEQDIHTICDIDQMVIGSRDREGYLAKSVGHGACIVAILDQRIVGFAMFGTSFYDNCFISLVIVHPEFRRLGAAKHLITYIEHHSPTQKLFTSTNESNVAMQQVCQALGFIRSGIVENLDEGDPELIYYKSVEEVI